MLRRLTVENYALIERLDMELDPHLNIITGETGAGKSILLGALGLLLGNKNDSGTIGDTSRSCVIEGVFDVAGYGLEELFEHNDLDYEAQTVIRRMISPAGKSRAFVNDVPVQLAVLRELGAHLIDIHSQHQNQVLADEAFRIRSLDTLAGAAEQVAEYAGVYGAMRAAERELQRMESEAESMRRDEEWLRYQVAEFEAAQLRDGELAEAEGELSVLENADRIIEALTSLRNALDADQIGVLEQLAVAENTFAHLGNSYPRGAEMAARLHSVVSELKDIGASAADESDRIEADPERLQRLTDRVNMIYSMCQKHRVSTLEELMAVGDDLAARLNLIQHGDEALAAQRGKIDALRREASERAAKIRRMREEASRRVSAGVAAMLVKLGMPEARFEVVVVDAGELLPTGGDRIRFMFTANGRMAPQPVERVASGGETSRVMLALKAMLAERSKLPTIIFDEIDTGVSGRIADAMGEIISSLAERMQVVDITHLPQVASKGDTHFVVYKEQSRTNIERLDRERRVREIAKMLSGSTITDAALSQASILLGGAGR